MPSEQSISKASDVLSKWNAHMTTHLMPKLGALIAEALDEQVRKDAEIAEAEDLQLGLAIGEVGRRTARAILSQLQPKKGEKV